jgi:macrolide transport system ATP-binding/permease protein
MLFDVWSDVRYALRKLASSPGFSAMVVITLALGIGVNTTMFSVVNAILFEPIYARTPQQIVAVFSSINSEVPYSSSSYLDYVDVRDRSAQVLSGLAAYTLAPVDLKLAERTQHITAGIVTGNYLSLLGSEAMLGRTFLPDEDRLADPHNLAILNVALWRKRFSADPAIIGKSIRLNKQNFTVIGVVDEKVARLRRLFEVDVFVPATAKDMMLGQKSLTSRQARQFFMLGRLAPGVSLNSVQAKMKLIASELHSEYPTLWSDDRGEPSTITAVSEQDSRVPPQARLGVLAFSAFLLAIVGTVLFIACTNLASLSLARALGREKEIAVRVAVGSTRWRLIRQLLTESLILSVVGAIAALVLTRWTTGILMTYHPPVEVSIGLDFNIDHRVMLFGLFITLVTAILFGLTPALHATGADVLSALNETSSAARSRRYSFRHLLIVAEVAMSIVLLMPTGLFLRSLQNFRYLDLGFNRDHLALISITLDPERYSAARGKAAYREILDRLRQIPGVQQADLALTVPLSGVSNTESFQEFGTGQRPRVVDCNVVGPRYFETMNIPILRGRGFDATGHEGAVAIVNDTFAKTQWPNQDPVGKHLASPSQSSKPIEIVGVVKTGKYDSVAESATPVVYRALDQEYNSTMVIHVRTKVPPVTMLSNIAREIQAYDSMLSVFDAKTMDDALAVSVAPFEALAAVLGIFGGLALTLTFAGLYGLIAYQTARRTREIGIRMALGATPSSILGLMAKQGLKLVALGILIGVPASIGIALLISSFLFQVAPLDPLTYLIVPLLMGAIAVTAIIIPAMKGLRLQPVTALRTT